MDYDAFLSHHSADKPLVRALRSRLMRQGLRCWFDATDLRPGQSWQKGLEEGIRGARAVLVCLGESGIGPWEDEEMQAALDLAAHDARPVIPVLLPGAPEKPRLSVFLKNRKWADLRGGIDDPQGIADLVWGITGTHPDHAPTRDPRAQLPADLPDFTGRTYDADAGQIAAGWAWAAGSADEWAARLAKPPRRDRPPLARRAPLNPNPEAAHAKAPRRHERQQERQRQPITRRVNGPRQRTAMAVRPATPEREGPRWERL